MTRVLVTGGSGFLGSAIIEELLDPASPLQTDLIRIFDTKEYRGLKNIRVDCIRGDVRDYPSLLEACKGMDVVIHSAAVVDWSTFSADQVMAVNYGGTQNAIKACKEAGVPCLVYTSSLDAVFGGKPLVDIDESVAYPEKHPNAYCESKFLSEKIVLASNSKELKTCVLRPSDIYGEGDPFHIGSLIAMAKGGFYVRLGDGKSKSQHVYVRNMAHAHLLAANALLTGNHSVEGQAYLITDGPGSNFFKFFDRFVEGAGYRIWPKNLWIPRSLAMIIGAISEAIAFLWRPIKPYTPKMSRFAVIYTCSDFTFSSKKALHDFGYFPKYSEEDAFEKTISFYKNVNIEH
ncbi:MAG: NAD-dependent epimerase/dehydratase family protein [Bacteroidota bacterium]